jgi:hypothetical protein
MEDKYVATVPALDISSSTTYAPDKTHQATYGPGVGGSMALHFNLIQFLLGMPVVDYDSISVSSGGSPAGQIVLIDTARRAANYSEFDSVDQSSTTYAEFVATTIANRSSVKSYAGGDYTLTVTAGSPATYTISLGGSPLQLSGGGTTFNCNVVNDVFDSGGDFHFAICLLDSHAYYTSGPSTGAWANSTVTFTVNTPTYTGVLNWTEICTTNRYDDNYASHATGIYFDTYRGNFTSSSDVLYDSGPPIKKLHAVGLFLSAKLGVTRVAPMERVDGQTATALGEFHNPSASQKSVCTALVSGRSFSGNTFQQPVQWTMLRGPGYVRILAEHPSNPAVSNVYFLGLMKPYLANELYDYPVAMLGDTYISATSPYNTNWWRKFSYDQAIEAVSPSYRYECPFIVNANFSFGTAVNLDTDVHFPISLRSSFNQPDFSVATSANKMFLVGSKDDSVKVFASPFDGPWREGWFDGTMLWHTAENGIASRMAGTNLFDRHIEPVVFFQASNDGYTWNTSDKYETLLAYPDGSNREAMGCLPGIYWVQDKLLYHGSTLATIDDDDVITITVNGEERTLHTAYGYSYGSGDHGAKGPQVSGEDQGVVAFDINEV